MLAASIGAKSRVMAVNEGAAAKSRATTLHFFGLFEIAPLTPAPQALIGASAHG